MLLQEEDQDQLQDQGDNNVWILGNISTANLWEQIRRQTGVAIIATTSLPTAQALTADVRKDGYLNQQFWWCLQK